MPNTIRGEFEVKMAPLPIDNTAEGSLVRKFSRRTDRIEQGGGRDGAARARQEHRARVAGCLGRGLRGPA
jgi:hypothetical protein